MHISKIPLYQKPELDEVTGTVHKPPWNEPIGRT